MPDSTDDDSLTCTTCGTDVAQSSDHRVATSVEDDAAAYLHFCSDECLDDWESSKYGSHCKSMHT